ncbi:Wadjet anti-phage system protein JetA family protein [uncultured Methylobacterium sp.]|uniref:Wadjet anti-phage system protein JetA family protein n=1 Tax=uncultured Methylobacterium sp. TaxID=157278 RepID=UPI0035C968C4
MLFAQLPDDLFRPLASPSRGFNAALLLHLHRRVMGASPDPVRKADLLTAIGDFSADWALSAQSDDEPVPTDPVERRSALYRRLTEAGWLTERRERYVPVVDFDPEARLLLEELSRMERGQTRSYGAAILDVLGSLESAIANPGERSEALGNAARAAHAFLGHVRGLAGAMRKIEERILHERDLRAAYRLYFEDFVARHLISDYRTLHTRFNPFRFRSAIVREAGLALRDALLIRALAEATLREGRAADLAAAERAVRADLAGILAIFEGLDRHLDAVDAVVARMERRIAAAIRYGDRPDSGGIERAAAALRAVGVARAAPDVAPAISLLRPPLGAAHLSTPRGRRAPIAVAPLPDAARDPEIEALISEKDAFRRRTTVTPETMAAFIDRHLGPDGTLRGSEIAVADVDAFVVFQRLREIDVLFEGELAGHYAVARTGARLANGWLDCPDFVIRRRSAERRA